MMIGKISGVVIRFKELNKYFVSIYCICYKLLFVCCDINDEIVYM